SMIPTNSRRPGYFVVPAVLLILTAGEIPCARFVAQSTIVPKQTERRAAEIDQLIADGVRALERNELSLAKKNFEQVIALDPKQVLAHTYLGLIADKSGNLKDAEHHFAIAAELDPAAAATRNNLGAVLLKLGRPQQDATQFEASLRLNPNQP